MPQHLVHSLLCCLILTAATTGDEGTSQAPASQTSPYQIEKVSQPVPSQPYERYFTTDALGRRITFYVSQEPVDSRPLPLVVYVHGSGCQSHFARLDGRIIPQNGHATLADVVRGRARLLIVEKPGARFLDMPERPGTAMRASDEFLREHTLDRWVEALSAAMKAARTLPAIDSSRTLVIGHSEGGLVACKVAANNAFVTEVASLAGGGPSQLFDLVELAREGALARDVSDDPQRRALHILGEYGEVLEDPTSTTKQFLGHPYRRWSTFGASSPMEQLARTDARIYIAQGGSDRAVHPMSARMLYADLVARGKKVTLDFVPDADHSFAFRGEGVALSDGWKLLMSRVIKWYID